MPTRRAQRGSTLTGPPDRKAPGRPAQKHCRALVPMDTAKVRARLLKDRIKAEKSLWKAEEDWRQFTEVDQPAYRRWEHAVGGPLRADVEALQGELNRVRGVMNALGYFCDLRDVGIDRILAELVRDVREATGRPFEDLRGLPLADWLGHAQAFIEKEHARLEAEAEVRRKAEEDMRRRKAEDGDDATDDEAWDEDFADGEDEDWDDSEDDPELEDMFEDILGHLNGPERDFFSNMFGFSVPPPPSRRASRPVRDLYRDLCRKLHPDIGGELTPARRALWDQVQRAYEEQDVETLEALLARVELEVEPASAERAAPSRLLALIQHLKTGLNSVRALIRRGKREPAWGFTGWTEARRLRVKDAILSELCSQQIELRSEVDDFSDEFARRIGYALRQSAHSKAASSRKKPPKRQKFDPFDELQGMFDFV